MVSTYNERDEPLFEIGRTVPSRRDDPPTSAAAAQAVTVRANNQRGRLLRAYRWAPNGLTDDEAQARAVGVSVTSCYWKRCSELRDAGFITTTGVTRAGRAGVQRIVCFLTPAGATVLNRLDATEVTR